MKLATRMSRLGTETAFEVLAKARALEAKGKHIVHLEIGEPDFDTPRHIVEAGKKALDDGFTHYGPSAGLPQVREAVAQWVGQTRSVSVHPDQVVVTAGAKPIMWYSIMALCEEGDEVIYPNPGFPIYESVINFVGAKAVPMRLREENEFRIDINELKTLVTNKTKLIIINSPANPTGGVLTKKDLQEIAAIAASKNITVLTDEIYDQIVYGGAKHESYYSLDGVQNNTILLNGFSKAYAMTGWRLGFGVFPKELQPSIARLVTNSDSCTASFTQIAGIAALKGDHAATRAMVAEFEKRRDLIVDGLNSIKGFKCLKPQGAFYVFPNIKGTGKSGKELSDLLLNEAGVACLAGTCFGQYGEGYLRFSYANSQDNIREAIKRIKSVVN